MVAEDIAGLSSIIGQINREAVEAAEKITAKAKEDAKQIIKKATESAGLTRACSIISPKSGQATTPTRCPACAFSTEPPMLILPRA